MVIVPLGLSCRVIGLEAIVISVGEDGATSNVYKKVLNL